LHLFGDFYGAPFSAFRCDLVQREGFVVFINFKKQSEYGLSFALNKNY